MEKSKNEPTVDDVKKWVRNDLESAHYCLGLVLKRYPAIVDEMAESIYEHAMAKENGAAIDHVDASEEAKGYAE